MAEADPRYQFAATAKECELFRTIRNFEQSLSAVEQTKLWVFPLFFHSMLHAMTGLLRYSRPKSLGIYRFHIAISVYFMPSSIVDSLLVLTQSGIKSWK
jgi:hypothetical protein